jgi:hypothetical protein
VRLRVDCLRYRLVGQHEVEPAVDLCLVGRVCVADDGGEVGEALHNGRDLLVAQPAWRSHPAEPAQLIALYRDSQPLMVKRPSRKSGGAWTGQTSWDKPLGKNTIEFHSGVMDAGAPYIPAGPGLWKTSSPPLNG